jgi:CRISPR-associated endonuclease/helicase Cas3
MRRFHDQFQRLTGQAPFPWQCDLFQRWMSGVHPEAVDVPTGLGKTRVLVIWLIARAFGAQVPRRLFYVVDRRAVVDQATRDAEHLTLRLGDPDCADIASQLGLEARRLPVASLRGGLAGAATRGWLADPAAAAIIVGTVDMIGSRLLFEGYGVTPRMRPFHAAMTACDSLIVLDEAHLVPPFLHLLRALPGLAGGGNGGDPFRLLALSATGRRETDPARSLVVGLTAADHADATARQRLKARKSLVITEPAEKLADELAREAWTLSDEGKAPRAVIVFCNRRDDAEKVHAWLTATLKDDRRIGLFTGGRRGLERKVALDDLERLGFLAGNRSSLTASTFLVATSAAEVGVDLDADDMVADAVPFERLVQRLGRVNRRGDGAARVRIVPPPAFAPTSGEAATAKQAGSIARDAVARAALALVAKLPLLEDGGHDASPLALVALRSAHPADVEDASTAEPLHPAVGRALIEAWSMTSLETHTGRPEITPWLRGWVEEEAQTRVVWRAHLPVCLIGSTWRADVAEAFFADAPPQAVEELETETFRALDWLLVRAKAVAGKSDMVDDADLRNRPVAIMLSRRGSLRAVWTLDRLVLAARKGKDASRDASKAKNQLARDLAEATLVVDARLGGLSEVGYLADLVDDAPLTGDSESSDAFGLPFVIESVALMDGAATPARPPRGAFVTRRGLEGGALAWLMVRQAFGSGPEDDRSRSQRQANQSLTEHAAWVEARADRLAGDLGLARSDAMILRHAARLHDSGKASPAWQRAMGAPEAGGPYAKIGAPASVRGTADGYRHEFGSLLAALDDVALKALPANDRDLVLHLIAAHHGHARPLLSAKGFDGGPESAYAPVVADVALRFAHLQRRLGPWRLAWWETLLRAADARASADFDEGPDPDSGTLPGHVAGEAAADGKG